MRLLRIDGNADSFDLHFEEFIGAEVPEYAILSHTWGTEEVSYDDFVSGRGPSTRGYEKIIGGAKQAMLINTAYLWVDTCCIDKRSSAELTEAINSMYQWYGNSAVCFAYLQDVPSRPFADSRWFTRGWTLQEMIAPKTVVFFDENWNRLGEKMVLRGDLARITGIHESVLDGWDVHDFSVARRMSWASRRRTTRIEDAAYCLLGIFGVNMPLLYGEGARAFQRLQHEIVRGITDDSILSWSSSQETLYTGPLADSPSCFSAYRVAGRSRSSAPATLSPRGLEVRVTLLPVQFQPGVFHAVLMSSQRQADTMLTLVEVMSSPGEAASPRLFFRARAKPLQMPTHLRQWSDDRGGNNTGADAADPEIVTILNFRNDPITIQFPNHSLRLSMRVNGLGRIFGDVVQAKPDGKHVHVLARPAAGKLAGVMKDDGYQGTLIMVGLTQVGAPWCQIHGSYAPGDDEGAFQAYNGFDPPSFFNPPREHYSGRVKAEVHLIVSRSRPMLVLNVSDPISSPSMTDMDTG